MKRKMKQHKKNKSIFIAVVTTQAGSQTPDLGIVRPTARAACPWKAVLGVRPLDVRAKPQCAERPGIVRASLAAL